MLKSSKLTPYCIGIVQFRVSVHFLISLFDLRHAVALLSFFNYKTFGDIEFFVVFLQRF